MNQREKESIIAKLFDFGVHEGGAAITAVPGGYMGLYDYSNPFRYAIKAHHSRYLIAIHLEEISDPISHIQEVGAKFKALIAVVKEQGRVEKMIDDLQEDIWETSTLEYSMREFQTPVYHICSTIFSGENDSKSACILNHHNEQSLSGVIRYINHNIDYKGVLSEHFDTDTQKRGVLAGLLEDIIAARRGFLESAIPLYEKYAYILRSIDENRIAIVNEIGNMD